MNKPKAKYRFTAEAQQFFLFFFIHSFAQLRPQNSAFEYFSIGNIV